MRIHENIWKNNDNVCYIFDNLSNSTNGSLLSISYISW